MKNKIMAVIMAGVMVFSLSACDSPTEAQVVSYNTSREADAFAVQRRVVFINELLMSTSSQLRVRVASGLTVGIASLKSPVKQVRVATRSIIWDCQIM